MNNFRAELCDLLVKYSNDNEENLKELAHRSSIDYGTFPKGYRNIRELCSQLVDEIDKQGKIETLMIAASNDNTTKYKGDFAKKLSEYKAYEKIEENKALPQTRQKEIVFVPEEGILPRVQNSIPEHLAVDHVSKSHKIVFVVREKLIFKIISKITEKFLKQPRKIYSITLSDRKTKINHKFCFFQVEKIQKLNLSLLTKKELQLHSENLSSIIFNKKINNFLDSYYQEHKLPEIQFVLENSELGKLPWELLRASKESYYFAHKSSITRKIMYSNQTSASIRNGNDTIKILYILARPDNKKFLQLQEARKTFEELNYLSKQSLIQLEILRPPTYKEFIKQVSEKDYHIIHFDGHGEWDDGVQQSTLCFESREKKGQVKVERVTAERLQCHINNCQVLLFIISTNVLNHSHRFYFDLASRLENSALLAIHDKEHKESAADFFELFYRYIQKNSIEMSVFLARNGIDRWFNPLLYQNVSYQLPKILSKPVNNQYTKQDYFIQQHEFVQRDQDHLILDRALMENVSIINLQGYPGTGKTTIGKMVSRWSRLCNVFKGGHFWYDFHSADSVNIDQIINEIYLQIDDQDNTKEKHNYVLNYLKQKPSLLIWDHCGKINANIKQKLDNFLTKELPHGNRVILISNKKKHWMPSITKEVNLGILSKDEAENLVWHFAKLVAVSDKLREQENKIPSFLKSAGYLPLAICLALRQLKLQKYDLVTLVNKLKNQPVTDKVVRNSLNKVFYLIYSFFSQAKIDILSKVVIAFPHGIWNPQVRDVLGLDKDLWEEISQFLERNELFYNREIIFKHNQITYKYYKGFVYKPFKTFIIDMYPEKTIWEQKIAQQYHKRCQEIMFDFGPKEANTASFFFLEKNNLDYSAKFLKSLEEYLKFIRAEIKS
ncbi:CHAT domain-containing protein [Candidatus Uabimicrobium sp. HlEnr_7]|uniref:CHAT domain-containing protein n=1 Tax=Candidatus Uabimicrobium helgolandensis TaxID=3095367 RepID=UPI003557626F